MHAPFEQDTTEHPRMGKEAPLGNNKGRNSTKICPLGVSVLEAQPWEARIGIVTFSLPPAWD